MWEPKVPQLKLTATSFVPHKKRTSQLRFWCLTNLCPVFHLESYRGAFMCQYFCTPSLFGHQHIRLFHSEYRLCSATCNRRIPFRVHALISIMSSSLANEVIACIAIMNPATTATTKKPQRYPTHQQYCRHAEAIAKVESSISPDRAWCLKSEGSTSHVHIPVAEQGRVQELGPA